MRKGIFLLQLLFFAAPARAGLVSSQITEDFATYSADASSTAVWNTVTKTLQVPFAFFNLSNTAEQDGLLTIGTGSNGVFDAATMYSFDVNQGAVANTVTLDTSRTYQFTLFTLPSNTTLKARGTAPLNIQVLGDVSVQGTIDLSGSDGLASSTTSASTANEGAAGSGGGNGASGVSSTISAALGTSPGNAAGGGTSAPLVSGATTGSGGGGGGHGQGGSAGSGGSGGAAGSQYGDVNLQTDSYGGAGGGGGAGNSTEGSIGGGGGGGGGTILIQAGGNFQCGTSCQILANGGNGGGSTGKAGAGGGGAGGGILIYAAGTGADYGDILALGGNGGTAAGTGSGGGNGGEGDSIFGFSNSYFDPVGNEQPNPFARPYTGYSTASSYTIVSKVYDTAANSPTYNSITKTQTLNGGTITYEVAGSNDGTTFTSYYPESQLSSIDGYRYFRFQVTLQTSSFTTGPVVKDLVFNYSYPEPTFGFALTGCSQTQTAMQSNQTGTAAMAGIPYLVGLGWFLRRKLKKPKN